MLTNIWVFNLQIIDEIQNADINVTFKKFYFIVQVYNTYNKYILLTQLLTKNRIN